MAVPNLEDLTVSEFFLYQIRVALEKLLNKPSGGGGSGYSFPANTESIQIVRIPITVANTAIKGPDLIVPDGFYLVIKSDPTNPAGSFVYVGESSSAVININLAYPLVPNEAISYGVTDANVVYISGSAAGMFVLFTAEKKR